MNPTLLIATALLSFSVAASAAKPCEDLKSEINAKIEANQVKAFTLEVLETANAASSGTVVGSCEGGSKSIVYKRGDAKADPVAGVYTSDKDTTSGVYTSNPKAKAPSKAASDPTAGIYTSDPKPKSK